MKTFSQTRPLVLIGLGLCLGVLVASIPAKAALENKTGSVEYVADTNVKMFQFKGKSNEISAKVDLQGVNLKAAEIRVPVHSLKTGMEIRDKHTTERIFTAADGSTPDILFSSQSSTCKPNGADQDCELSGTMTFRGVSKPFKLALKVAGSKHATGHAQINVLDYGVKPEVLKWTNVAVDPNVGVDFELSL